MSYKNHWSSETNESTTISKIEPNKVYDIVDVEKLKTQFGIKFVLVADDNSRYWTNNKINEFINANKSVKKFHLETLTAKTFKSKSGEVTYIPVEISW